MQSVSRFEASLLRLLWYFLHRQPPERAWQVPENELTLGDRLLLYFAHEGLRNVAEGLGAPKLRTQQPFVQHALCWLAFPEDYTAAPVGARPNFAPWTNGAGACMLEA